MTPLRVLSEQYPGRGGHTYVLAPDDRIPENSWGIDLQAFCAYHGVTAYSDDALQADQAHWNILALADKGYLMPAPDGDDWEFELPGGWKATGYVISGEIAGVDDLEKCLKGLQWDDAYYRRHTYPLPGGVKRYVRGVHPDDPSMALVGSVTIGETRTLERLTPAEQQMLQDRRERQRARQ